MNAPDPEALGFSFSIVPTPGMTWPQVVALERQIEDYARERELLPRGCQLRWVLSSPQRSLSRRGLNHKTAIAQAMDSMTRKTAKLRLTGVQPCWTTLLASA